MSTRFEVPAEKLAWRCDLSFLPYSCTAEMTPLEDFIGQERAIRAIEFGLGVNKPGFNIFVTGLTGTGKTSIIKAFLKKITNRQMVSVADSPVPEDWCYVYNFTDADRPLALRIRRGWGKVLKADMEQFVQSVQREAKKMFESDEYAHQRQEMVEQIQKKQQQTMEGLIEEANRGGFTLRMTPSGIVLLPTKDGKPMQEADYLALPAAEKKRLEETRGEIEKKVEDAMREGRKLEREIGEKLEEAETRAADYLVRMPLADLKEKYREYPKVVAYLDGVRDHILKNLGRFKGAEGAPGAAALGPMQFGEPPTDPFLPYRVNVFVDNSDTQGPPIIVETNPTYHNVFGVIEKKPMVGGYVTDFTMIKAGSISRANGGYLVLYDRDVLSNAGVWEALQRVIKNRELRIEEPSAFFGFVPPQGLRPEPIPTDTKIIMIGDPTLYRTLAAADPDFRETFKVKADFNFEVDRTQENITAFACFISDYCNREGLRHFDTEAVARVIEQARSTDRGSEQAFDPIQRHGRSADRVELLGGKRSGRTGFRKARRARDRRKKLSSQFDREASPGADHRRNIAGRRRWRGGRSGQRPGGLSNGRFQLRQAIAHHRQDFHGARRHRQYRARIEDERQEPRQGRADSRRLLGRQVRAAERRSRFRARFVSSNPMMAWTATARHLPSFMRSCRACRKSRSNKASP